MYYHVVLYDCLLNFILDCCLPFSVRDMPAASGTDGSLGLKEVPYSLVEEMGRRPFESVLRNGKTFIYHPVIHAWGTTFAQHLRVQVVFTKKMQGLTFQSGDSHSLNMQKDGHANGQ